MLILFFYGIAVTSMLGNFRGHRIGPILGGFL